MAMDQQVAQGLSPASSSSVPKADQRLDMLALAAPASPASGPMMSWKRRVSR